MRRNASRLALNSTMNLITHDLNPAGIVVQDIATGAEGLEFDFRAGPIGHSGANRCDVSSELCCPGAKSRRLAPLFRFGVTLRV